MSFTQDTFAPVGANSTESPSIYSYITPDSSSNVTVSGYFDDKRDELIQRDVILVQASDGFFIMQVLADTSAVEIASNTTTDTNIYLNNGSIDNEDRTLTLIDAGGGNYTLTMKGTSGTHETSFTLADDLLSLGINPDTGFSDTAALKFRNTTGINPICEFSNGVDNTGIIYNGNVTAWGGATLITQDRGDGRYIAIGEEESIYNDDGTITDESRTVTLSDTAGSTYLLTFNAESAAEQTKSSITQTSSTVGMTATENFGVNSNLLSFIIDAVASSAIFKNNQTNEGITYDASVTVFSGDTLITQDRGDGRYATAAQGLLADSALQNGDNVSELVNDAGYITSEDDTIQDVYSRGSDVDIDNTEGAIKLSRGVGITDAAFNIVPSTVTPSTNLADGDFHVEDGTIFLYDLARTKFLSSGTPIALQFGKNNGAGNEFLRFGGDARDGDAGIILPWDATIVAMTLKGENSAAQSFDIEVAGVGVATLISSSSTISDTTLSLDVDAGETINLFAQAAGTEVTDPYAIIFVKRRKV